VCSKALERAFEHRAEVLAVENPVPVGSLDSANALGVATTQSGSGMDGVEIRPDMRAGVLVKLLESFANLPEEGVVPAFLIERLRRVGQRQELLSDIAELPPGLLARARAAALFSIALERLDELFQLLELIRIPRGLQIG